MDWQMPDMDGIEATRRIKSDTQLSSIPVIIMVTSFGGEKEKDAGYAVGVDDFLQKPLTASALLESLQKLLAPVRLLADGVGSTRIEGAFDFSGARILLVEDNEVNRQLAVELLEQEGCRVEVAVNGREAVTMVDQAESAYDLVLMDMQMPVMDGCQATRLIRQDPRFAALPIVAMTAHARDEERQKTIDAGMNAHIAKPIDAQVMFMTMGSAMGLVPLCTGAGADGAGRRLQRGANGAGIPEMPGVDALAALKRVDGNEKLYLWLLRIFLAQADTAAAIGKALEEGDRELAFRLAHTTKGLAGNIGADALEMAAEALETALDGGKSAELIGESHIRFTEELESLLAVVRRSLPEAVGEELMDTPDFADRTEVIAILSRLFGYIRCSDAQAEDYLYESRSKLAALPRKDMQRLAATLANFEYDSALQAVVAIASQLGVDLIARHEEGALHGRP
jgi:CheY-like chemotaxis protein